MDDICVSVWIVTYNHEKYIRETIDNILNQIVDFTFEIIIYDDASTDNTTNIVRDYEKNYPNLIKGLYQTENMYSKGKLEKFRGKLPLMKKYLRGKYIAVCDGDDFWIDSHKLQLQIDFMNEHPECAMTLHNAFVLDYSSSDIVYSTMNPYDKEMYLDPEQIIVQYMDYNTEKGKIIFRGNPPMASTVYRRELLEIDDFFSKVGIGDYTMQLNALTKGKIFYFDRIMSVYRFRSKGSWSENNYKNLEEKIEHNLRVIDFLQQYNLFTNHKYKIYIETEVDIYIFAIINSFPDISMKEFDNICDSLIKKSRNFEHHILERIKLIFKQIHDDNYISEEVFDFVRQYQHIVIWGAGKYGKQIALQLKNNNIKVEGYIISDNQKPQHEYMGKEVWKFSQQPFELKKCGIIIAVNPAYILTIRKVLEKRFLNNYICPFSSRGYIREIH